jgi:DNA-binding response OmpR family regulator
VSELPLILVIEDEYFLQEDLEKALADAGFASDILSSGEEALTLLMGGLKRPNALVTDVRLKGRLSGWEVARRIREKDPSFPVVYVTAYDRDWPSEGVPNSIVISKPFATAQLLTALSNLLNFGTAADNVGPSRATVPNTCWIGHPMKRSICPRCKRPMEFALPPGGMGQRRYRCLECERADPLKSEDTQGWLRGELGKES